MSQRESQLTHDDENVIELVESPGGVWGAQPHRATIPGLYERAKTAAIRRGHGEQTAFAGIGGLLGGVLGSFRSPLAAAVGALLGAFIGALVGRDRDRNRRDRAQEVRPVRRHHPPGVRIAR